MSVKTEQVEKNLVKLTFEVSVEDFAQAINKAYAKNSKKYSVPGFRKGKVPRAIIEKYYTEAVFYGDAINMKRQKEIYRQLEEKMIAATNLVLGIGSFTYQCATRDGLGQAMKATYCEITLPDGTVIRKEIFKDPKTVVGMPKKSLRGFIKVDYDENHEVKAYDGVTPEEEKEGLLRTVFEDGKLLVDESIYDIRARHNAILNETL